MATAVGGLFFASRWGDEGIEKGVSPFFDPTGFWDVCVPLVAALWLLGALFKALEARLYRGMEDEEEEQEGQKGGRKVTHVFCAGVVSRLFLIFLPWAPATFIRRRWDWVCTAPTVYETLAHLYHWKDTTAKLKWSLLGHHAAVLLVVWPLARLAESIPYPMSAISMPLFFEVGSAWSYLSYLVKSRGPRVLNALKLQSMEGYIIPSLIWLCYAGQRAMRAAAIWEGIFFLNENPEFAKARALQVVMIAMEIHGAWRCFKHLPPLGESTTKGKGTATPSGGGGSPASSRNGSSSKNGSRRRSASPVSAAGSSRPGGSPRGSLA